MMEQNQIINTEQSKEEVVAPSNVIQDMVLFRTEDEQVAVEVIFYSESVWLTQEQMAQLFGKAKSTINEHIGNIYREQELKKEGTTHKFGNSEFMKKAPDYYNLDVIISVGYRVKSIRGTQFRQWATKRLNEYIRKGFTMDDERLMNLGGGNYWSELLKRIRNIRISEKVFYRQILDIYATSVDYDPKADVSREFFKKVQNKMHFAVHGQTAAEVIYTRADAEKEFMGMTSFTGKRPYLEDALVAKNYLSEDELKAMGQIVSGYLDFAERQADRHEIMTMADWARHLDTILTATGEQLLVGNGSVTHQQAVDKATCEYKKYQARTLSDVEQSFLQTVLELEHIEQ